MATAKRSRAAVHGDALHSLCRGCCQQQREKIRRIGRPRQDLKNPGFSWVSKLAIFSGNGNALKHAKKPYTAALYAVFACQFSTPKKQPTLYMVRQTSPNSDFCSDFTSNRKHPDLSKTVSVSEPAKPSISNHIRTDIAFRTIGGSNV